MEKKNKRFEKWFDGKDAIVATVANNDPIIHYEEIKPELQEAFEAGAKEVFKALEKETDILETLEFQTGGAISDWEQFKATFSSSTLKNGVPEDVV